MKPAFIFVRYKTPEKEVERLKSEVKKLGIAHAYSFFIDNTGTGHGYAAGVNEGIRQAIEAGCDMFIAANNDISLNETNGKEFFAASNYFDIWGFAFKQNGEMYFGGTLDPWRMSGGLIREKPEKRFIECDFVSGSFMVIKKKVVDEIGFFDESYGMYYEEVDYALRAQQAGLKTGIDCEIFYKHFETSGGKEKNFYLAKNRLKILTKYGTIAQKIYELTRIPLTVIEEREALVYAAFKSPFFLNFMSLNISSLINKVLNFILFIFLIRYLSPNNYGIYTLVWAHVTLLAPLGDFGTTSYGLVYLPQEEKKKTVMSLISLRFFLSIIIFIATIVLAFIFGYRNNLLLFAFLISFVVFTNMMSGSYLIWTSIKQKLTVTSKMSVIFNSILIATLIGVVLLTRSIVAIFLVIFLFYNIYTFVNYLFLKKDIGGLEIRYEPKKWAEILKKSYVFVLISFFAGLYFKTDVFLLNYFKGDQAVGVYSAGYKFFEAMMLVAASYNISASPILAKLARQDTRLLAKKMIKDIGFLLFIGLAAIVGTYTIGPLILPYLLKGRYQDSIAVLNIVIFAFPCILVSSVLLNGIYVLKRALWVVGVFAVQVVINLGLNLWLIPHYSYIASSYITVLSELLNVVLLSILILVLLNKRKNENIS